MKIETDYNIDRETLQGLVSENVDRNCEPEVILESIKGKKVKVILRDEAFLKVPVEAVILPAPEDIKGASRLWVENWHGRRLQKPWGVKIHKIFDSL